MLTTTGNRRPLGSRSLPLQLPAVISPLQHHGRTVSITSKRAHSPDPPDFDESVLHAVSKRHRPTLTLQAPRDDAKEKELKRSEREALKDEFRVKYTRAFPKWTFYFDFDPVDVESASLKNALAARVTQLGAQVDDFFSNATTHLITDQSVTSNEAEKENMHRACPSRSRSNITFKSPVKFRGRTTEDIPHQDFSGYNIVQKALAFGMKIWSTSKLDTILQRCDVPAAATSVPSRQLIVPKALSMSYPTQRALTQLLASERLHGTTMERDLAQKRIGYRYFSKSSYFVLIEDIRQELATIHAFEYPIRRGKDGKVRGAWPVLYCHPNSRGPFIEFDEKERKRWERTQKGFPEKSTDCERDASAKHTRKPLLPQIIANKTGDLRRSVSMTNLRRRATMEDVAMDGFVDLDADFGDGQYSANASGFLASTGTGTYVAASGNSVGVTSTTGNTSLAGNATRNLDLPAALRGRIEQQVVTSRKVSSTLVDREQAVKQAGTMGPPVGIPSRPNGLLRKSRSTNTLKLPKRDEGIKPGYCESCRVKFEDFEAHVQERRHRKFAMNDANFLQLDFILLRVQRQTLEQTTEEERLWAAGRCEDYQICENQYEGVSSPYSQTSALQRDNGFWDDDMDAGAQDLYPETEA